MGTVLDWTQTQKCAECLSVMKSQTAGDPEKVRHAGKGICVVCYQKNYRESKGQKTRVKAVADENGKTCFTCKNHLPFDQFRFHKGAHYYECRLCFNARKYSMNRDSYLAMMNEQNGKCKSCGDEFGVGVRTNIDHDHSCCDYSGSCGRCVRGILCSPCNTALGAVQDNIERLVKLAQYLKNSK